MIRLIHPNAVPPFPHDTLYLTDFLPLILGVFLWLSMLCVVAEALLPEKPKT